MHSHGPSVRLTRRPPSSSTKTVRYPLSTKKTSSTSCVCGALPCPGGTYMTLRVKARAGITVGSSCLPEPPAPMKRCCARRYPSILASSKASQSPFLSRKRPIKRSAIWSSDRGAISGGISCRALAIGLLPRWFMRLACSFDQLPDPWRRERQLARLYIERCQRRGDRIGDYPAYRNDATFTGSLGAERVDRRRMRLRNDGADAWKIARGRHQIVGEPVSSCPSSS